jgi:hypothetical protein
MNRENKKKGNLVSRGKTTDIIHRTVNHKDPLSYPHLENGKTFSSHVTQNEESQVCNV